MTVKNKLQHKAQGKNIIEKWKQMTSFDCTVDEWKK